MSAKKLTFEQQLSRLEEIVAALEKGDAPLADSLKLFEEGTKLIAACSKQLDQAEQQVVKLMKGADGAPVELPFEDGLFLCFGDWHDYLVRKFGDYMQLPPEEEQAWRHHPIIIDFEHNYEELKG